MIHIIDPRITYPLPDLAFGTRKRLRHPRYLSDWTMHSAFLVAVRMPTGRYTVLKTRFHSVPKRPVTRARLERMVRETWDRVEGVAATNGSKTQ